MIVCVWEREIEHTSEVGWGARRGGGCSSTSGLSM